LHPELKDEFALYLKELSKNI